RRREPHRRFARSAPLRCDPVLQDGEALPAQGRVVDLGRAHDRMQARSQRRVPLRHLGRRGHLVAQARRRAHSVPRNARRPDRLAESLDVHAAARLVDRDGAALRPPARGAVHRPGPVQDHQRHARSRGGRRAVARDQRAVARMSARSGRRGAARRRRVRRAAARGGPGAGGLGRGGHPCRGHEAGRDPRQECRVTASIGICLHPDNSQDDQAIMKNADMAMYLAKEEGKNNFQFFTSGMKPQSIERLSLESNLRRALELDEFSLHYQAKVNFKSGAITGVEALLRWYNPELGSVPPTRFIPLAEDTGLIVPIGAWVLRTACAQSVAWQKQGLPPVCLSVNLSMRQLNDEGLLREIERVLAETGLAPELLELEVTESTIMHNAERAVRVLTAIKNLGVRLAIDDFGTVYSSLAHLKRFPIDTLKVDRSFIREVPN